MPPVYIVGAGPGDPTLITLRGHRLLTNADVVVHDHLVHPRLLRSGRPDAEYIDVGDAAPRQIAQEAICLLLVEKAREGRHVVRLKWGDPFVFDSGGKEALFLHEHGIPFEVVPGVPALVAHAAYAGIPLTYPDAGDAVTLVRGYEDGTSTAPQINWESVARLEGSIACYAGPSQLAPIVTALLDNGCSPDEAAALVTDGTLPQQSTARMTLGQLADHVKSTPPTEPAVLVVGRVAGLREHLRWFDARPLFGRRIVVTRAREQAGELVERLEELGAQAIEAPTIRIEAAADLAPLDEACEQASSYDWIVFTSVNGVEHFMRRFLGGGRDIRTLKGPRLCAVGPSTAEHLARYYLHVAVVPPDDRSAAIVRAMRERGSLTGQRVLLPRTDIARETLPDELRQAGAAVVEVAAYRTVREPPSRQADPDIYKMLLEGQIDVVTFTSASSVRHFVTNIGEDQAADLLSRTAVASIGPVTAEAAQQLEINTTIMPASYTIPALVDAIVAWAQANGGKG
ncbi:MAG: uroporphyrinogen-III C-methyltransferase [Luteitalea sp.]|nr:uroporphyrinogen-III C-methyltransferase [Luteitalea sp.]